MTVTPITAAEVADAAALNSRFAEIESDISASHLPPTGMMIMYAGAAAPSGWLFCDGSAVGRIPYAALFAVLGTTYGSGDGSLTFNLPDLRGRTPIGAGTGSGLSARTLAQQVGEETHLLTVGELPAHTHGYAGQGATQMGAGAVRIGYSGTTASGSAGGTTPHNNMQPSSVLNFLIKV